MFSGFGALQEVFCFLSLVKAKSGKMEEISQKGPQIPKKVKITRFSFKSAPGCRTQRAQTLTKIQDFRPGLQFSSANEERTFRASHTLEGPTRKPRHASVFSTHSDTQAVPALHCIRMFQGIFSTRYSVFKTHRHTVGQCLKSLRHLFDTLAFLKRAFRHARVRF